jgi:hypothetical protein
MGRESGENIMQLMAVASLASQFLIEKEIMDDFIIFIERETGKPIKTKGILEKIKFWKR